MKKVLFVLAIALLGNGAFSQMEKKMHDCVMMKDGKMMAMKSGKSMMMTKDMKMSNGTMVMKDGTVKMKDGSTSTLKDGEYVDMKGKMGTMDDKMKMGKMKKEN